MAGRVIRILQKTHYVLTSSAQNTNLDEILLAMHVDVSQFRETVIYARTSGYLRRRYVDIGSKVKAGQLLATIESPEVDPRQNPLRQSPAGAAEASAI